MTRQEPDERYSDAVRAAVVEMIDGEPVVRSLGRRPLPVLQTLVAVAVLGLVATASVLAIGFGRGGPASTPTGSPIADPRLVSCGAGQGYSFAPFGCGDFVSTDATGDLAWMRSKPIGLQFDGAEGGEVSIEVPCGGLGSVPVTLTTTRITTKTDDGVSAASAFGPCAAASYRALDEQVYGFLDSGVAWTLAGDELTLARGGAVVRLHRAPLPSPTPVP